MVVWIQYPYLGNNSPGLYHLGNLAPYYRGGGQGEYKLGMLFVVTWVWVLNLYYLESGAEGIEPVASMFVSDFVADEPDGPEMIMIMIFFLCRPRLPKTAQNWKFIL